MEPKPDGSSNREFVMNGRRKTEWTRAEVLGEFVAMIEANAETRVCASEYEMAYQVRVALAQIRFAIKALDSTQDETGQLHHAAMQLLDAYDRLQSAEQNFQIRWRETKAKDTGVHAPSRVAEKS